MDTKKAKFRLVIIFLCMKNIFQKVSVCVLTQLIGQSDRAVCKRHYHYCLAASPVLLVSTFKRSENIAIALACWITKPLAKAR